MDPAEPVVSVYVVLVVPVFATSVENAPPDIARSILYPVMVIPPFDGADQFNTTLVLDRELVSPVTWLGTFGEVA